MPKLAKSRASTYLHPKDGLQRIFNFEFDIEGGRWFTRIAIDKFVLMDDHSGLNAVIECYANNIAHECVSEIRKQIMGEVSEHMRRLLAENMTPRSRNPFDKYGPFRGAL